MKSETSEIDEHLIFRVFYSFLVPCTAPVCSIRSVLASGEQVKLSGFGNFELRTKSQRPGRNPKTGEDIPIKARRVVTFKPGQKFKSRVENAKPED